MRKTLLFATAALVLAGLAHATPEGSGNIALSASFAPPVSNWNYESVWSQNYGLQVDAPLGSGLGMKLGLAAGQIVDTTDVTTMYKDVADVRTYNVDATLNIYPAGFAGKPFIPGVTANPDGWLFWPSIGLGYAYSKTNNFFSSFSYSFPDSIFYQGTYTTTNDWNIELALPLTTWLSLEGAFTTNINQITAYSMQAATNSTRIADDGETIGFNFYIDLVSGAGADKDRPFVPHFGRLGQLDVDIAYNRLGMPASGNSYARFDSYSIVVGAPVTSFLAVAFIGEQTKSPYTDTLSRNYSLMLSCAFGGAKGRVDQ